MTTPPFGVPPAANPYQPLPQQPVPGGPKRVSGKQKALFAALVVVALGLGTLGAFGFAAVVRASGPPVAGSCLYLSSLGSETQTYTGADCSERAATYRVDTVVKGRGSCRGEDYVQFELYLSTRSTTRPTQTLCLALNVASGECVRDVSDESKVGKVACDDPKAEARAVVHDGERSASSCDDKDLSLVYAGPPVRTICLEPTGASI
ncbi:LppU/SCO3897 family protein [Amycolatopsis silviterrae]|uniref:Tat pathway signal sequence domain protein n=1 Tax=Amycolatopsis silviterrae TaxID=1656914 RepID=A0ABW5HNN6_9PSEU